MARMYSRKKGKAGSKKPENPVKPSWLRYSNKEMEMLISKLAKEGKTASAIGLTLRDTYGVPSVKTALGKRVGEVLKSHGLGQEIPEDLSSLMKKLVMIKTHREKNRKDMTSLRGYQLTDSKIKRLVKYYKSTGRLPVDWKYDIERVKLLIEQ